MSRARVINQAQAEEVKHLISQGATWLSLTIRFNVSYSTLRCAIDETYRRKTRENEIARRLGLRKYQPEEEKRVPPPQIIAERDACYAAPHTLGMVLLGEPEPGRSAWERLRQKGAAHTPIG